MLKSIPARSENIKNIAKWQLLSIHNKKKDKINDKVRSRIENN